MALCLALRASANPPARLPPPILFGVARPESVPLPVPRLIPLSRAGEAAGFRAAGTGLFAGGAGGVGFALPITGGVPGLVCPFATTGMGTPRGGAAGGGGGGGGAARACSISSTYAVGVQPSFMVCTFLQSHQLQISAERTIPVGAVKYISTSSLRDDWFALGVGSPQEPDPLISCVFKTEFFLQFKTVAVGGMNLKIGPTIEYNKKPGKPASVKVQKDPAVARDDMYKSGTIHVPQGEAPTSVSRPTPRGKAIAKPITSGKLLRPGGPGGQPSKAASRRPVPAARPAAQTQRPVPTPAAAPVHQTVTSHLNGPPSHIRNESASSLGRAAPPPSQFPIKQCQF